MVFINHQGRRRARRSAPRKRAMLDSERLTYWHVRHLFVKIAPEFMTLDYYAYWMPGKHKALMG
jgi:hypothetical protein